MTTDHMTQEVDRLLRVSANVTTTANNWRGYDYHLPSGAVVRTAVDDTQVSVHVFDRHMLLGASATFTDMPVEVITTTVAAFLGDEAQSVVAEMQATNLLRKAMRLDSLADGLKTTAAGLDTLRATQTRGEDA